MLDSHPHNGSSASDEPLVRAARGEADALLAAVKTATVSTPGGSSSRALDSDSFPGYELLGEIHRGGQGVVYQAIHKTTQRKVAVKVMREGRLASDREKARFDREVEILGRLSHPSIVTIHDRGSIAGNAYFVMDYIAGQPLDVYMASGDRSIPDTLRLFARICEAVDVAHLNGIIHRDLKPSNIRIDASGEPHILDFGLAHLADDYESIHEAPSAVRGLTITGQFVGSLPWASPEQAAGKPAGIDLRTDVYSLGVVLYQMLTRRFPYEVVGHMQEVMRNVLEMDPVRPRNIRKQIDDEVETIVLKCLSKERARRYQNAGELARDVRRYLAGEPIEAKRDSAWYYLRKTIHSYRIPLAAVATVLLAVLGTAVVFSFRLRAAEDARMAAERAHLAIRNQALADQEKSLKDRGFLTFLLGRLIAGEPPREGKLKAVHELLATLGDGMREGKVDQAAIGDLARVLLDVRIRGRRLTAVGVEPMISVQVGTRAGFWVPGLAQVVTVTALLDGEPFSGPAYIAELGGGDGQSEMGFAFQVRDAALQKGEHVFTGSITVQFAERSVKGDANYAQGVAALPEDRTVFAECELPISPFRFTVAEGVEIPLAIADAGLAAATRENIVFEGLAWSPGSGESGMDVWKLKAQFGNPFAYLAFDMELRDARNRLLAALPFVVDPQGKAHLLGGWTTFEVDGRTWSEISLSPPADLERDAESLPVVAEPVTFRLTPSRAAALGVPEVDAYLAFEMSDTVPVKLRVDDEERAATLQQSRSRPRGE